MYAIRDFPLGYTIRLSEMRTQASFSFPTQIRVARSASSRFKDSRIFRIFLAKITLPVVLIPLSHLQTNAFPARVGATTVTAQSRKNEREGNQ